MVRNDVTSRFVAVQMRTNGGLLFSVRWEKTTRMPLDKAQDHQQELLSIKVTVVGEMMTLQSVKVRGVEHPTTYCLTAPTAAGASAAPAAAETAKEAATKS